MYKASFDRRKTKAEETSRIFYLPHTTSSGESRISSVTISVLLQSQPH